MSRVRTLARLQPGVEASGARHVVPLLRDIHLVSRPSTIALDNHLVLAMDDISVPLEGYFAPADEHVSELVKFLRGWDRRVRRALPSPPRAAPAPPRAPGPGGRPPPPRPQAAAPP